jgi:hypothetical protein
MPRLRCSMRVGPQPQPQPSATPRARARRLRASRGPQALYLAFLMFRIAIAPVAPLMTAISRIAPVRFFFQMRSAK